MFLIVFILFLKIKSHCGLGIYVCIYTSSIYAFLNNHLETATHQSFFKYAFIALNLEHTNQRKIIYFVFRAYKINFACVIPHLSVIDI